MHIPSKVPKRSIRKQNLYKLIVARSDITAALNTSELFIKNVKSIKDNLYYPLTISIVVCYSRPFTMNKPFGKLDRSWCKYENKMFQTIHERLIDYRHKIAAHSDYNERKVFIEPPGVPVAFSKVEFVNPEIAVRIQTKWISIDQVSAIRDMCQDLGARLNDEVKKETIELYGSMSLPNAPFELRVEPGDEGL